MKELQSMVNKPTTGELANKSLETANKPLDEFAKFGRFVFFENLIPGVRNLDPDKEALRNIFLQDSDKAEARKKLKNDLLLWIDAVSSADNVSALVAKVAKSAEAAKSLKKKNLKTAVMAIRELEKSYRSAHLFFVNTGRASVDNVEFLNAPLEKLANLESQDLFIKPLQEKIEASFDNFDLRNNISLLVIPGYLKPNNGNRTANDVISKLAEISHQNKVMFLTDFADLSTPEDVLREFKSSGLASAELNKSNVMMMGNYLLARGRHADIGELEPMYIPPSAAYAGAMCRTSLAQPIAGRENGVIYEVYGTRFPMKKSEASALEEAGLIPMTYAWEHVVGMGTKPLYNGDNLGLKTYSVVRVFDFIAKMLADYLNRKAGNVWDSKLQGYLRTQIAMFLDKNKLEKRLFKDFEIVRIEADPKQQNRIFVDIKITSYFIAQTFLLNLGGHKGEESWDVQSKVSQAK